MARFHRHRFLVLAIAVALALIGGVLLAQQVAQESPQRANNFPETPAADAAAETPARKKYPVHINRPGGPPRIATGKLDSLGREISVACGSCHANLEPNHATASGRQLTQFHQGLHFQHSNLSCVTCHNPDDYNTLRLAHGQALPFAEVQKLCAQCHAPQARDFEHGAHGGMTGYWDLERGPRQRKNCIDCHDPHAPAFPSMVTKFKPFDRFLSPPTHGDGGHDD